MAIGDPWDSSYDPRENGISQYDWMLKMPTSVGINNHWTERGQWGPDHSYLVPQDDSSTIHDRRGGRFCTQGCGCVKLTSEHPNKPNAATILPHELAIEVYKAGANETRKDITRKYHGEWSGKDIVSLVYTNGAWRGRKDCNHASGDGLKDPSAFSKDFPEYLRDPCRVSGSDCHFATNKFKSINTDDPNDYLDPRDFNEFRGSIDDNGLWSFTRVKDPSFQHFVGDQKATPRYIEDYYVKLKTDDSYFTKHVRIEGTDDFKSRSFKTQLETVDADGNPLFFDHLYNDGKYCTKYQFGNQADCEAGGGEWLDTPEKNIFIRNRSDFAIHHKDGAPRLSLASDGYVGLSDRNGPLNDGSKSPQIVAHSDSGKTVACVKDGFTPLKRRPYCRNPFTGHRMEQECEELNLPADSHKTKAGCISYGTCTTLANHVTVEECQTAEGEWTAYKWLYGDEETCLGSGVCEKPEDIINTDKKRSDNFIEARCEGVDGLHIPRTNFDEIYKNKKECEENGHIWVFGDVESCEARHGTRDAYCSDNSHNTKADCEEADGTWYSNQFTTSDWIDHEYEPRSCCGQHIVDQNHPSRTPQFSGSKTSADGIFVKDSNLENATCFTPYEEYVLMPPEIPAINQFDRNPLYQKDIQGKNTFWTLLIRPCRFWDSCFQQGAFVGDNKDGGVCFEDEDEGLVDYTITNQKDCDEMAYVWSANSQNSFNTGCGEEIVLKIPTNQLLNDSNFNLTLSDNASKRGEDLLSYNTKRDMSVAATNTKWRETQPLWDLKFGLFDKVYEWWNVSGVSGDPDVLNPPSILNGPFPADAMYETIYDWWCRTPDANFDGIADGADGISRSSQKDFCNNFVYSSGSDYSQSLNPKGAETFAKFNLQPQPFKAAEERQLRAKTIEEAKIDYSYWFNCVSRSWAGDSGHWFVNYGQDYFLYFDFEEKKDDDYQAHCNKVSDEFNDWVKSHIGHLSGGTCSDMNAIGWVPVEPNTIDESHPCFGCESGSESNCSAKGYCEDTDGTFESSSESDCTAGTWKQCCEYFKKCTGPDGAPDARVVIGYNERAEYQYGDIAKDKAECEREQDSAIHGGPPGAGGTWDEGCGIIEDATNCNDLTGIPDELADIVFGEQHGTCQKEGEDPTSTSKETCKNEGGEFTADSVGGYTKRIGPYIKPAGNIGRLPSDYEDPHSIGHITDGVQSPDVVSDAKEAEVGNSPDYWHETGLYPMRETQVSFISDSCVGTKGSGRVQFASNENPIKITSPYHNLQDGDRIDIRGVLGNFAANVTTNKEWTEMQWEDKIANFNFKGDEEIVNPSAICPNDADGTCDNSKYYACDGQVVDGEDPPPAPFFIAKNVTADTFELYACDKTPIDGTVEKCAGEDQEAPLEWYSVYGHMENITLKAGEFILSNAALGTVSDVLTEPGWNHLHFAIGEPTSDAQPLKYFAKGVVNGISFDTGYSGRRCFAQYPNEPRPKTHTKLLSDEQFETIRNLLNIGSLLESTDNGDIWIDDSYSIAHTHEAFFAVDFSSHDANNCTADSLFAQSIRGKGKTVYNPFPDSDADGSQLITEVVGADTNTGLVVLKHHVVIAPPEVTRLQVWASCPFTGKWETYEDPTNFAFNPTSTEVTTSTTSYRPGFSGSSQKWEYRANDYYVAIEQKGVCPVCNDHYIPEQLNATLSTVDSEYLNVAGCKINPCYEANVCIDDTSSGAKGLDDFDILYGVRDFLCIEVSSGEVVDKEQADCVSPDYEWKQDSAAAKQKCIADDNIWVGEDWWNYSQSEGYCCSDPFYHKCEGQSFRTEGVDEDGNPDGSFAISTFTLEQDIESCKENPQNYGRCEKDHKTDPAYTVQGCSDVGGAFTDPLSSKDQCERFLRRRLNLEGVTNCRRCADVYTNENGVPIMDKVDDQSGYYSSSSGSWITNTQFHHLVPLDNNGDNCCGTDSSPNCDCLKDEDRFPTCERFVQDFGICGHDLVGSHTMGDLKAQCVEIKNTAVCTEAVATFEWQPDGEGGGEWQLYTQCAPSDCTQPTTPTQASHPPSDPYDIEQIDIPCGGGVSEFHWEFDPCGCFGSNIAAKCEDDKMHATDAWGSESCEKQAPVSSTFPPNKSGKDESGWYHDNSLVGLNCGVLGDTSSTDNIGLCYHQALANKPIDSTCPGLSSVLDVPMEYDGQVWRSEWTLMDEVGTKQCQNTGSPKDSQVFPFSAGCKPEKYVPGIGNVSGASDLVYTNADCSGCDMPQYRAEGVSNYNGTSFRNAKPPKLPEDGHFIRLILGCGDSIPSIEEGELRDGGLGPSPQTYQSDSMKLWAEITNCTYHDDITNEGLKVSREPFGVKGNPPCFPDLNGCTEWEHFGATIDDAASIVGDIETYMFAGKCVSEKSCGPKGPCAKTECCKYEGQNVNFLNTEGPLWNGSEACSTGGNISNVCQAIGFQMGPDKRQETLTVHDIININHLTGEGTLVAKSNGGTCGYSAGTTVSIGMAGPREASSSSKDDYTRNKHAANPFLRGTVITQSIQTPKLEEFDEDGKSIGFARGDRNGKFIYIKVKDITPLINKNSRKDRHLKYNDIRYGAIDENFDEQLKAIDKDGKLVDAESESLIVNEHIDRDTNLFSPRSIGLDDKSGSAMVANKKLKYPYGNNPYPVATQTISGTTKTQMWPKGKVMSPDNLESLRFSGTDWTDEIVAPGRTGMLWRDYSSEQLSSKHSIVDSSFFAKKKEVAIDRIVNVYDPLVGTCIDNENYKEKRDCTSNGHIWVPNFLNTYIGIPSASNFAFNKGSSEPEIGSVSKNPKNISEKIVISGTIAYRATCKGSSLGYCYKSDGSGKGKNPVECSDSSEFEDNIAGKWIQAFTDAEADKGICEDAFGGKWVIGKRNPDVNGDPDNNNPIDLENKERDFEAGCPAACELKGFYTDKACEAHQSEVPPGGKRGECYECVNETIINSDGEASEFIQCPRTPIDGSHLALRHDLESYLDTIYLDGPLDERDSEYREAFGEKMFAKSSSVLVLANEEHITVNDEAKIWSQSKLVSDAKDSEFIDDLRERNANNIFDPTNARSDFEGLGKDECSSLTNGYYWNRIVYNSSNEITIDDTIDSRLPICLNLNRLEGHFLRGRLDEKESQLQLEQIFSGSTLFSTQGYYDFLGDRFNHGSTAATATKPAGVYSYKQLTEACELSINCHFEKVPFECRGGDPKKDDGWCKKFTGDEDFVTTFPVAERTTRENCGNDRIFTADISTSTTLYAAGLLERHNQKECLEAGHEIIPAFLCYRTKVDADGNNLNINDAKNGESIDKYFEFLDTDDAFSSATILTPQECEAAGGNVFYDGIFNTPSRKRTDISSSIREMRKYTINKDSGMYGDPLSKYKSRDFIFKGIDDSVQDYKYQNEFDKITYDWGLHRTETGVSIAKRKWKGLIYANEAEGDYKKYVVQDEDSPTGTYMNIHNGGKAYWSRHGGAFDITISQKLPENKARDNNSDKPVNLEYWLKFPQICCNLRGPANFWACPDQCWPHANGTQGPVLDFLDREYGIQGESLIHVNITEKYSRGGGGSRE